VPVEGIVMTTMETNEPGRKSRTLPLAGEHVAVHCPGFSCLSYRDQNGTWKNVFTDEALPNVTDFSPIG
jgi:hypothetical protein